MPKPTDTELLDFLQAECIDLRCHAAPTGGGDADVMWQCVQHYQAPPKERPLGLPKATVRAAIASAISER